MKKQKKVSKIESKDPLDGDLSDFIAAGIESGSWKMVKFELTEKKDQVISLRLSEKLLAELKKQAKELGIDTQKFIRISLEKAVRRKAG